MASGITRGVCWEERLGGRGKGRGKPPRGGGGGGRGPTRGEEEETRGGFIVIAGR